MRLRWAQVGHNFRRQHEHPPAAVALFFGPMQAYLRAQRSWLTVERLPGYAPDLNPVELLWGNVKGRELANLYADNLGEIEQEFRAVKSG